VEQASQQDEPHDQPRNPAGYLRHGYYVYAFLKKKFQIFDAIAGQWLQPI
jgi:hypothetical protein